MRDFIISFLGQFGYWGIFFLIAVENLFPPIPSEVILTFSGFLTTITPLTYAGMVLFSTIGSVAGALILYAVGRALTEKRLKNLLNSKLCKALHFDAGDIEKARARFAVNGAWSVLLCRCVPILRSLISIPAGMARMKLMLFTILTTIGSTVWNCILIGLGAIAGENWDAMTQIFASFSHTAKILLIIAVFIAAIFIYRKKRLASSDKQGYTK